MHGQLAINQSAGITHIRIRKHKNLETKNI